MRHRIFYLGSSCVRAYPILVELLVRLQFKTRYNKTTHGFKSDGGGGMLGRRAKPVNIRENPDGHYCPRA